MSEEMATNQASPAGETSSNVKILSLAAGAAIGFAVGWAWAWISGQWTPLGWGAVAMVLGGGIGMMIGRMASNET